MFLRLANPERISESVKRYRVKHPDRIRDSKKRCNKKHNYYPEYSKKYRAEHPEIYRESDKRKRAKNPELYRAIDRNKNARRRRESVEFRILEGLRGRVLSALNGKAKSAKTLDMLGCSIADFKIYIESRFEPGMTWENRGKGNDKWQLDHIIPCALFDLNKPEHQKRCFHFSNLQPMWGLENRVKGKESPTDQFNLL